MSSLIDKTKIGIMWSFIEKISVQVVAFAINIIIARILSPHDYGTIGLLTIFMTFSNVFIDSGFSRALIQKIDRTERDFSTALIFNILVSLFLYALLFLASPAIARFYKTPELVGLQRAFFVVLILNSLTVVQNAKLQINIDFKSIAIANFISVTISGVAGIVAALQGWGAWALVVQALTKSGCSVVCLWIIGRWLPRTGFSFDSFKRLFSFGSKLLLSGLLGTGISNVELLFIGKYYNPTMLGYYTRAQQFPELTAGTLASVLNNATFPLLASMQNDRDQLIATFKKIIRTTALFMIPLMTGIALLSEEIILVLLGSKWLPAADLLFWLTFSYIFTPLSIMNMSILNAIGRSDLFLKVDLSKVPFIIITMIITFPISLKAVVIGKCLTSVIYFYINGFMPGRLFGFGAAKQLLSVWKTIVATVIMAVAVVIARTLIHATVMRLLVCTVIGIVSYFIVLLLLREDIVVQALRKGRGVKALRDK